MKRLFIFTALLLVSSALGAQQPARPHFDAFDVATIKPVEHDPKSGRYIIMQGPHRWVAKDYTLKLLIAAAYDLNPRTILGGPSWLESDHYDIVAITPGELQPTHDEQMIMLRKLIADRFQLQFHRESKDFSIYQLEIAKDGPKLRPSTASPDDPPRLLTTVYPQKLVLPAQNATMHDFVSVMQRAMLDRPVVDKTGLTGRYDFTMEWAPDETQFGGELPSTPTDTPALPLFIAIQQQLGLRLTATRGPVDALVVDHVQPPSAD